MPGYPRANGAGFASASGHSGPMPAYRPANGAQWALASGHGTARPGYPPPNGRPATANPPSNGNPMPGYPRANGAGFASASGHSGPMPAYRPANGAQSALASGHGTARPGYPPPNGRPATANPPSNGRRLMGWMPFGQRLVLLPKGLPSDWEEELREHRDVNGGWLRPAVFGAMDGLVTNASLIAGVGGGGGVRGAIVLTGIAGLIAGAFSMATGEYISVTSQNELTLAEVELERKQHARDPAGKLRRLTEVFIGKGVSPNLAEAVVRQISADPDRAVATHVREELGIDPDDLPSPRTAAAASFAAFTVGALLPLSPFLLGYPVLKVALAIAAVAAVVGGAAVAKLTGRSMIMGGLRQFSAAFLATGMAFVIGHLVGGHVS